MGSLSVGALPKVLALLFIVCLTTVAAGSCLSYGHSCWGGHGKRSNSLRASNPLSIKNQNDGWYLSKLFRFLKEKPIDSSTFYNAYNKDVGIVEKLFKSGHFKHSIGESVEDGVPRDQNTEDFGNDADREEPENNDVNSEELFIPEEDKLMWYSKFRNVEKMIDKSRKTWDNAVKSKNI